MARGLLASPAGSSDALHPVLQDLHEVLVAPLHRPMTDAGVRRLIIVPHAVLTYLPFAALRDGQSGRYLVEELEIVTLPTASALWAMRHGARGRTEAEPPSGTEALAPLDRALPATRGEVRAVAAALENVTVRRGRRASEPALRRALAERSIVHVATHAALNRRNPLFSTIQLAAGRGDPADDGRLEVHEILSLRVRSGRVFLSGCETGVGMARATRYNLGEDYATLGQALLYAGAGTVVATLWRITDVGAARFAALFYEELVDSDPIAALAKAQRRALADAGLGALYYWAPYTVLGTGSHLAPVRPPKP